MNGFREVAPAAAFGDGHRFRIVDVREPSEFVGDLGHIPGAELVPLATVLERARGWHSEDEILVVCRSGGRSGRAAEALVRAGFRHVHNLTGGMLAYRAAGLPTE